MFRENRLKKRLLNGERAFGCWVSGGSVTATEILGHIGFDFLLLDHEHGVGDSAEIVDELRAAETTPTPTIVRVPWNDHVYLKRALDAGVDCVMIPSVENADEARAAVAACLYPPAGRRGYAAGVVRASTYGLKTDYAASANENILTICQVESASAVNDIEAICAIEGLDCVFIGVNDLAGSIGKLEQTGHPDVRALVERAEEAILRSGKLMGTVPNAGASVEELFARGYNIVAGPHDVALLRDAAKAALEAYRSQGSKDGSVSLRAY